MNDKGFRKTQQARNKKRDRPLVSICTVTRNRSHYLPLLQQCILAQTYPIEKLEWVIIDDSDAGHPPFHPRPSKELRTNHLRLKESLPLGAKRNLSHLHCKGEIIVYMDDDDIYPPCRVEHAVDQLEKSDCLIAGSTLLPILFVPEMEAWISGPFSNMHATANTFAFKRELLKSHRYEDTAILGEERHFLKNYKTPMVQLDPLQTVLCLAHHTNTFNKRRLIAQDNNPKMRRLEYLEILKIPSQLIDSYSRASRIGNALVATTKPPRLPRIAVITPYHKEDLGVIERCHRSVASQNLSCTHFLIADGPGRCEVDDWNCRHIRLGKSHGDNGNTPRSIGGLCAMNEGFDCIAYLDVDNWYRHDHLETVIAQQKCQNAEVVFTCRELVFPEGDILSKDDAEDLRQEHVDTSCMVLFRPAFKALSLWAEMPPVYGPLCDRVYFQHLKRHFWCVWTQQKTVFFETWYWGHFEAAGRVPPANVKFLAKRTPLEWDMAIRSFAERSHTPLNFRGPVRSSRRAILISILGPPRSGSTLLQRELCLKASVFGIPENGFLFWYQALFGEDTTTSHYGRDLIEGFDHIGTDKPENNWWRNHIVNLREVLEPSRSYTVIEAHLAVISALLPERCQRFLNAMGHCMVVDKTLLNSLAASLLFAVTPGHRCLLSVRDPIDQICAMRSIAANQPGKWLEPHRSIAELCDRYLDYLLIPLRHAAPDQLQIVAHEALLSNPDMAMLTITDFCGLRVNPDPRPLRSVPNLEDFNVNPIYQKELEAIRRGLGKELTRDEPSWKARSLYEEIDPHPHHYTALSFLTSEELEFAFNIFEPFYQSLPWIYSASPHAKAISVTCHEEPQFHAELHCKRDELISLLSNRLNCSLPHVVQRLPSG